MFPEKTFTPDSFRLLVNTPRKVPPAFGDMPRKNVHTRQPSAFGQSFSEISPVARCDAPKKYDSGRLSAFGRCPAKSLASVWRYAPKKRSRQMAFGFWSILFGKSLQRPAAITRKSATPDSLRLLVNPFRKIPPVARCEGSKKCNSGQPSAFSRSSAENLSSDPLRRLEKVWLKTVFGFESILFGKSLQRPAAMTRKSVAPDSFQLLVNTSRKTTQVARCNNPKKYGSRQLPAFGQSFSENLSIGLLRYPEKVQLQTTFGFGSILSEKPLQPSDIYPGKIFRPDGF